MSVKELAPVFRRAAEVIESNGHCKGSFCDLYTNAPVAESAACAAGAICVAVGCETLDLYPAPGEKSLPRAAVEFLSKRIYSNTTLDDPVERVADWNDADERTLGEVIEALREAASAAEAVAA
jgi:hypothetical protein